jgi:hypothetical protein
LITSTRMSRSRSRISSNRRRHSRIVSKVTKTNRSF